MTTHNEPAVVPLRRPPVRQATLVRSNVEHTFDVFVRTIGVWWPVQAFSAGQDKVRDVTVEPRVGGRVYEIWQDGTVVQWGELLAWQPPHRFTMTWTGTPAPTEVELTFTALGPALTRVAVEHRGWEALSDAQLSEDCALPGGYSSGAYSTGWATILRHFATAADATPSRPGPAATDEQIRSRGAGMTTYTDEIRGAGMTTYTDEMMRERLAKAAAYTLVMLRVTDKYGVEGTDKIIWEHGRRNMELQADGVMPIVFPVGDETGLAGIGIFVDGLDEVRKIMNGDPAIQAGVLSYSVHPCRGLPGSALPEK